MVFFVAIVASVLASLVIDVVVLLRMRVPHVSDVTLPTDPEAGRAHGSRADHAPGGAARSGRRRGFGSPASAIG